MRKRLRRSGIDERVSQDDKENRLLFIMKKDRVGKEAVFVCTKA